MPKGIIDKAIRNYRYSRLIRLGATREEAKQGMDFSQLRFDVLVARLTLGMSFDRAKAL